MCGPGNRELGTRAEGGERGGERGEGRGHRSRMGQAADDSDEVPGGEAQGLEVAQRREGIEPARSLMERGKGEGQRGGGRGAL